MIAATTTSPAPAPPAGRGAALTIEPVPLAIGVAILVLALYALWKITKFLIRVLLAIMALALLAFGAWWWLQGRSTP